MTASDGRHAIVTGGSSGLGRSIAALMAARGYRVSLVARDAARLEAAANSMPGQVTSQAADVTDHGQVTRAVDHLVAQFGPCDVLVATAGAARPGYFLELDEEAFRSQMELNYFGVLNAVRAVAPAMVERRTGRIVAIASTAALVGVYGYAAYAPSKFAVRGLMEVLRGELRPHGVQVSCVFPPDMDTPGFAAENLTKPEEGARISAGIKPRNPDDVARAVLKGIEDRRFAITVDRQTAALVRFGGLFGPLLDRLMDHTVDKVRQSRSHHGG